MKHFSSTSSESDKIHHHGYDRFYPIFLGKFLDKKIHLLEIGVQGGESMSLWNKYVPNATIHGMDIDEKPSINGSIMYKVDQSNESELTLWANNKDSLFSVIIDDGSHVPEHQALTIETIWPTLRPGGIYIIEDIETSWWKKGRIYNYTFDARRNNLMRYTRNLSQIINREFSGKESKIHWMNEVDMFSICHNCLIFQKCEGDSSQLLNRAYGRQNRINEAIWWRVIGRNLKRLFRS